MRNCCGPVPCPDSESKRYSSPFTQSVRTDFSSFVKVNVPFQLVSTVSVRSGGTPGVVPMIVQRPSFRRWLFLVCDPIGSAYAYVSSSVRTYFKVPVHVPDGRVVVVVLLQHFSGQRAPLERSSESSWARAAGPPPSLPPGPPILSISCPGYGVVVPSGRSKY